MVYDFTDVYTTEWFDQYVSKPSGMELSVTHSVVGQTVTFDAGHALRPIRRDGPPTKSGVTMPQSSRKQRSIT